MQTPDNSSAHTTKELRSDAKQLGAKAARRLETEVDDRKGVAVNQAHSLSSAIGKTADELDDDSPKWLKSALQDGARKIQQLADTVDAKGSGELLDDVQSFAREKPIMFLGACAATGFAVSRILKAGSDHKDAGQAGRDARFGGNEASEPRQSYDRSQPWGDGVQNTTGEGRQSGNRPFIGQPTGPRGEFA